MSDLEDYILLMLSMKRAGKSVTLDYVTGKANRDFKEKYSSNQVEEALRRLAETGLIETEKNKYKVSDKGRKYFKERLPKTGEALERINSVWVMVYKAKQYYPVVVDTILEFCKDRRVGFYCVFTEKHFFRRQFAGKYITLKTLKDVMSYVDMLCIDVIPCVHRIGSNRPDWLVVDLDAGRKVGFDQVREATKATFKVLEGLELRPALKFSGSRGAQVWSRLGDFKIPTDYRTILLPGGTTGEKNYFTFFADAVRFIQSKVDEILPGLTTSVVGDRASREDKILLDWSSMKPEGLVRAPYVVHHKTGLVSLPLELRELDSFTPEQATMENALKRYEENGNEFILREANPNKIVKNVIDWSKNQSPL